MIGSDSMRTSPSPNTASLPFPTAPALTPSTLPHPIRLIYSPHFRCLTRRTRIPSRLQTQHHISQFLCPTMKLLLLPCSHFRRILLFVFADVCFTLSQTESSLNEMPENAPEPSRTNEMNREKFRFEHQKQNGLDLDFPRIRYSERSSWHTSVGVSRQRQEPKAASDPESRLFVTFKL